MVSLNFATTTEANQQKIRGEHVSTHEGVLDVHPTTF